MKRVRCLLVDDEPLAISLLKIHIERLDFLQVTATCPDALKALEILKKTEIDLMFLDIRMPAISGLDFLKILHRPPKVIITTAYREYALDGYDLDITDYLLKPITFDRFFKAIERYLRNNNLTGLSAVPLGNERAALYIKSAHRNIKVNTSDILYVESLKDYVKIYTAETSITAKFKISDMEVELASKGFLRVHRSFIINLSHLTAFTSRDVEIGKIELPIGESYKELVFQTLKKS